MVELALVAPLLILLTIGAVELGVAWGRAQSVVQASATGARTASQAGLAEQADQLALRSIKAGMGDDWTSIERIVVYEAVAGGDGQPPTACTASGITSGPAGTNCNVYTDVDLATVDTVSHFASGPDCGAGRSANWCPTGRDNNPRTAGWLGVWIEYERDWMTGAVPFAGRFRIAQHTVMRLEPRQ